MSDRLTEIRARLDAATPGPWLNDDDWATVTVQVATSTTYISDYRHVVATVSLPPNADLIAHAPADIAWLLAEVDELTKRVRMYEVVKS